MPTQNSKFNIISSLKDNPGIILIYITLISIGICSFLYSLGMSYIGDDLNHIYIFGNKFPHWYQWPLIIPYSWLVINGRFGDMLYGILSLSSPNWLMALLSAIFETLFYIFIIKLSGLKRDQTLPKLFLIALVMFTFCWWDSFFLFVVKVNYLWATTFILITSWFILFPGKKDSNKKWMWLMIPFSLISGWMHEASGIPISFGFLVYFFINRNFNQYPLYSKIIMGAFVVGNILSLSSPGIWSRFLTERTPDDPAYLLILKSCFYALLLIVIILALTLQKKGRKILYDFSHSYWIIFAIAGISQIIFVAAGGIIGRSGWSSQTYSIIAIFGLYQLHRKNHHVENHFLTSQIFSFVLFVIILFHNIGVCHLQLKANKQLKECEIQYIASNDGIVYFNPTQRNEFPWWSLSKNKACVDNDDYWCIKVYNNRLGNNTKEYRLLPIQIKNFRYSDLDNNDLTKFKNGWISRHPIKFIIHKNDTINRKFNIIQFKSITGDTINYIEPKAIDPGDRDFYTKF